MLVWGMLYLVQTTTANLKKGRSKLELFWNGTWKLTTLFLLVQKWWDVPSFSRGRRICQHFFRELTVSSGSNTAYFISPQGFVRLVCFCNCVVSLATILLTPQCRRPNVIPAAMRTPFVHWVGMWRNSRSQYPLHTSCVLLPTAEVELAYIT